MTTPYIAHIRRNTFLPKRLRTKDKKRGTALEQITLEIVV
jgi:hypothetical protein